MNEAVFERLSRLISENKTSASQGLNLDDVVPGVLYRTRAFNDPEFFYLVTEIGDETCRVIPGSLDGLMAGPDDIVLPKNVLGDWVCLMPSLAMILPVKALGRGFAQLDNVTFARITGQGERFPSGLPYISNNDSRKARHERLLELSNNIQGGKK